MGSLYGPFTRFLSLLFFLPLCTLPFGTSACKYKYCNFGPYQVSLHSPPKMLELLNWVQNYTQHIFIDYNLNNNSGPCIHINLFN